VERNENDLKLCELFQQCHVPTPRHSPYARVAKIVVEPSMRSGVRLEFVEEREPSPFLTPSSAVCRFGIPRTEPTCWCRSQSACNPCSGQSNKQLRLLLCNVQAHKGSVNARGVFSNWSRLLSLRGCLGQGCQEGLPLRVRQKGVEKDLQHHLVHALDTHGLLQDQPGEPTPVLAR